MNYAVERNYASDYDVDTCISKSDGYPNLMGIHVESHAGTHTHIQKIKR